MRKQPNAKRDDRNREDQRPGVDQRDCSTRLSRGRRQTEKKNPAEMRIAESDTPIRTNQSKGVGRNCRIGENLADQRKNHDDPCVGMPGTKEILAQWILHITTALVHQRSQQKISAVLDRRNSDKDGPAHQSGFASHNLFFNAGSPRSNCRPLCRLQLLNGIGTEEQT